ncbi:MAG TPA: hypothetical protein VJN72_09690 [Gaiellales bacterium]|nr:hypothetical protein [Gaiellales bacterium]
MRQYHILILVGPGVAPAELGAKAVAADGWLVLCGRTFCRECAWTIEDSLDRRPFGPDADLIRAAIDHRARVARVDVTSIDMGRPCLS